MTQESSSYPKPDRRIIIELTNRCNLRCHHCFSGRHGGRDDLALAVLDNILAEAKTLGFGLLGFTGGDPTLHRDFEEIIRRTRAAGYRYTINTNGKNFTQIYPRLLAHREALEMITFSMDGASEATHDRLRGKGSYRRLLQAMSICVIEQIPFSINMVVTSHNQHEVRTMAEMATNLGSHGLRYGHLMPAPITTELEFDLSPWERKLVEAQIWKLRHDFPIPIAMAPGYHTTDLFPCAPLHLQEINVDCHGMLTKCCHLSGHGDGMGTGDIVGDLNVIGFTEAFRHLEAENQEFKAAKLARLADGSLQDTDFFSCWYCTNHYNKLGWLQKRERHPWQEHIWQSSSTTPEKQMDRQPIPLVESVQ